jgi:hypothetical protein
MSGLNLFAGEGPFDFAQGRSAPHKTYATVRNFPGKK